MVKMKITADSPALQELAASLASIGQKGLLPATEAAFKNGARLIADTWKAYASGKKEITGVPAMKKPSAAYARGVKIRRDSPTEYTVINESKAAGTIEYGMSGYDMKTTHPFGKRSRVGVHWNEKIKMLERVPYLIVPFSWGTPCTVTFHNTMSEDIYDIVKRMKKSNVLEETHFEENWAGDAVQRREYAFNERLVVDDAAAYESGMVRMNDAATGKSSYFTFRIISARSPKNSWIHTGIPARHVTEGLQKECGTQVVDDIQTALKTDLGFD